MASGDFKEMSGSSDRLVFSYGVDTPSTPFAGTHALAMRSKVADAGVMALQCVLAGANPLPKGVSIRATIQRSLLTGGAKGVTPFLFACSDGDTVDGTAYLLGLEDNDPARIVLAKDRIRYGIHPTGLGSLNVLRRSTEQFNLGSWVNLRLDAVVNLNGDTIIQVFRYLSGVWTPIDGMAEVVDDVTEINTGSAPLSGGYVGLAAQSTEANRRVYFDAVEIRPQS